MAIRIDKQRFTPEELAQFKELLKKATVNQDLEEWDETDRTPHSHAASRQEGEQEAEPTEEKTDPRLRKALEDLEALKKSVRWEELSRLAQRYAPLGLREETLAETLRDLEESSPANYAAYLQVLDESLDLINRSGLFGETGRSRREAGADPVGQIQAAASALQAADPMLRRDQAVAKAWENHPELVAKYEQEYRRR